MWLVIPKTPKEQNGESKKKKNYNLRKKQYLHGIMSLEFIVSK